MAGPSHAQLLREYLEQLAQLGLEQRVLPLKDWMRLRLNGASAVALGAALTLSGCGSDTSNNENSGGVAGTSPAAAGAGGWSSAVALYAAPMTGGVNSGGANTGGVSVTTTTSAANTGGSMPGVRYAIVMSGGAKATPTPSAGGVVATVAIYAIVMERTGGKNAR
jgi:hypothetical protein